jgi:hypothetical protein
MATDPSSDVVRWVEQGEHLFGKLLQILHHHRETEMAADALARENQRLQAEMRAMREEVHRLREERVEAAQTLKAIAEHVTRLATVALQRLGKPTS